MLSMLRRIFRRQNRIQTETRPRAEEAEGGSIEKASSQSSTINEEEQRMKRLEKLKRDLQKMENERDELRGILAHYTNKDLNDRNNFEKFMLTMQYHQMMTDLKKMPQEISEALCKSKELTKENQSYWISNRQLLCECNHQKNKVKMLWTENRELQQEQFTLDADAKHMHILCIKVCQVLNNSGTKQAASESERFQQKLKRGTDHVKISLRHNSSPGAMSVQSKGSVGKASSQPSNINEEEQIMKTLDKLKRDLQKMENERDELRENLSHYTNQDLNDRNNFETFMLKMQYHEMMTDLKKMPQELSGALSTCKELTKENQIYWISNRHFLGESNHQKHKVKMLWTENRHLLREQIALEEDTKLTNILCTKAFKFWYDSLPSSSRSEIFQQKLKQGTDHVKIHLRHNSTPGALSVQSK
ncbi:Predicted gene 17174 [Apodemus speciosus]|uniref:Predicted gene 17174 n=1 Tax=Apodemus speciosus TaxID=105296 RepID=A0ABQ0FHR6_APOSI